MQARAHTELAGKRVLLVEDEWFVANEIARALRDAGADVVGMAPTVTQALKLIETGMALDGAVVDLDLHGEWAYPVADALAERGVPYVFATAYDGNQIPLRYRSLPRCQKPFDGDAVASFLTRHVGRRRSDTADLMPVQTGNHLLSALDQERRQILTPYLEPVTLKARARLELSGSPVQAIVFLDKGLASLISRAPRLGSVDFGLIGAEGIIGASALVGNGRAFCDTTMLFAGTGWRLPVTALGAAEVRDVLHGRDVKEFVSALMRQITTSILSTARCRIEERLARWLAMICDRTGSDTVHLSHEALSHALGVRRASITLAIQNLERGGLIVTRRGQVEVRDRDGIVALAKGTFDPVQVQAAGGEAVAVKAPMTDSGGSNSHH